MTAVDRLAAIIAEHQWYVSPSPAMRGYCLNCLGLPIPVGGTADWAEFATFSEYAAHLAASIASADDLAVISLPKPDDEERAVWRLNPEAQPGYPDGSYVRTRHWPAGTRIGAHGVADMRVPDAERAAAALLAAVKAAEAVDRGEQ